MPPTECQNLNAAGVPLAGIPLKPNLQPNYGQLYHYVTLVRDYYMAVPFIIIPHYQLYQEMVSRWGDAAWGSKHSVTSMTTMYLNHLNS